jgi:4,5-DOPA dioxygenase extradiol
MKTTSIMPVLFIGHGNPMNAIENNEFSQKWAEIAAKIPRPKSILCISAHWETWGTLVTGAKRPETIHDFGGFPDALYRVSYPAPGDKDLAQDLVKNMKSSKVTLCTDRGLDHGCWSVLKRMYPAADIPVVQLSLDQAKKGKEHFETAKELAYLREHDVLIIGSGNMVHNLYLVDFSRDDFNAEYGFDWAVKANETMKTLIVKQDYGNLCDYGSLGEAVKLAVPTPEHYFPMLYTLALRRDGDGIIFFNDKAVAGSLTMTSFLLG